MGEASYVGRLEGCRDFSSHERARGSVVVVPDRGRGGVITTSICGDRDGEDRGMT